MVGLGELRARVSASYDRMGVPSWPDPRPPMARPRDEEYSRVTEPERYRIVHVRARVWADRLGELPGVEAESLAPAPLDDKGRLGPFDRGVRLTSSRPGTLPLLLLERDVRLPEDDESLAVLHIGVARPEVAVAALPDCGCDACDSGSVDLLEAIDETIGHLVGGPFVMLRGPGWYAQWYPDGGSSGSTGPGGRTSSPRASRRHSSIIWLWSGAGPVPPDRTEALVGRPWLE